MPNKIEKTIVSAPTSGRDNQTAIWIATTVIFALLFFLSTVLDMKVRVSFGQSGATNTTSGSVRTTTPGGIASQVGGC